MSEPHNAFCKPISFWLIASAATNLFLVGFLIATLLRPAPPPGMMPPLPFGDAPHGMMQDRAFDMPHGRMPGMQPPPEMPSPSMVMEHLAATMAEPDAKILRDINAQEGIKLQGGFEKIHAAMPKLSQLLRQEKPDLVAINSLLDTIKSGNDQMHATMATVMLRAATELSADARQKIAAFLEHMP
jgi:hypothetical protein